MDPTHVSKLVGLLVQKLRETKMYESFIESFSKCTTNAERVGLVYSTVDFWSFFEVRENYRGKSKRQAECFRVDGNKLFKEGNYSQAVHAYTQSILLAPDDSQNLSLAYNNRSTANFYLKKYALSFQDIKMAFRHGYPQHNCYKLHQRAGRCMYYLRQKEEAKQAFHDTILALDKAELSTSDREIMTSDMKRAIDQCDTIQVSSFKISSSIAILNYCHQGIPKLSGEPNKEVPCLSDAVEVRLDNFGGRGLFARRNVDIGEVVIVETPFTSALLKEFNQTHCQNCCNRVSLPLPCRQCSAVVFCSLSCRDAAWNNFHWAECRLLESLQDSKGELSFLATRMILKAGLKTLLGLSEEPESERVYREAGFSKDGVYRSDLYVSAHSLVNHADVRSVQDILNRTVGAVYFLKHLEFVGFFSQEKVQEFHVSKPKDKKLSEPEGLKDSVVHSDTGTMMEGDIADLQKAKFLVGGHILRNIMMLPCNAHEVSEFALRTGAPAMSATTELAAAIYPVLSLVNHSCDPSIVRHSFGNVCVARAIRSIRAGQELRDNYGALYPTMPLTQRQRDMQSQYFFTCSCEACLEDWPQYFSIPCEVPTFRCSVCDGKVFIPAEYQSSQAKCLQCKNVQDINSVLFRMNEADGTYRQALTAVIDGQTDDENMNTVLNYLKFVESNIHRPWRDINDSQEAWKQCLNIQANCYPVL